MFAPDLQWQFFKRKTLENRIDTELRNKIAIANRGLVRRVAVRYAAQYTDYQEDLEQIGFEGLLQAVERFDPTAGNKFSSLAVVWIRGKILHYLRDKGSIVKVPRRWRELSAKAEKLSLKWMVERGCKPSAAEIAEELKISERTLEAVQQAIENQCTEELNEEMVAVDQVEEVDSAAVWAAQTRLLQQIAELPERDRLLLHRVYFLRQNRATVARDLGISTRINAAIDQALSQLHVSFRTNDSL